MGVLLPATGSTQWLPVREWVLEEHESQIYVTLCFRLFVQVDEIDRH